MPVPNDPAPHDPDALAREIDRATADADRLCGELKEQISRAKRLVEEARSFLGESAEPEPRDDRN